MKKTGDTYLDSEDFRALLKDYEMMVEAGQPVFMDADDLTDIAEYYNCIGEQKKSDDVIEYARSISPDAASPLEFLAHKAINEGHLDEAQRYIDMVDDETDPEYQYLRVEMCLAQGQMKEASAIADKYFNEIDEEDQDDFCFDLAHLYANYEYFKKAKGWFDMVEKDDENEDYLELQSRIAYGIGNYDLCIDSINKLIDNDPYSNKYWNILSQAQIARGSVSDAITSSEYALAIDPNDVTSLYTKAMGLINNDNRDEAIKCLKKALDVNPDAYDVLMQLANCYVEKDDLVNALPYANRAIEVSRDFVYDNCEAYKTSILILASLNRPNEALAKIDEAERNGNEALEPDVFRGYVYLSIDDPAKANAAFKKAFDESKDIPSTTLRIIMALQDNGYYDVAYYLAKDFISGDDGSKNYDFAFAYLAFISFRLGKDEETLKYYKIAFKRAPALVTVLLRTVLPEDLRIDEYYDYLKKKKNKQQE